MSSPHCAVAVGHLSLDDTWPQLSLRTVVGGVHLSGIVAEGQELVSRPSDFGLQLPRQVASGHGDEKRREAAFKLALFLRNRRGGEAGDAIGQIERLAEPQLEPQRQIVRAMLQREGRVARQMRQAGLMPRAVFLLGRSNTKGASS